MAGWRALAQQAKGDVEAVADDPAGRLRMREAFYLRFGHAAHLADSNHAGARAAGRFGFGRSELDFMRWEIERGVLAPLGGSPWWRAVNLDFLCQGRLAELGHDAGLDPGGAPATVRAWLTYMREPSSRSWYRAHNSCIVSGYAACAEAAEREPRSEQIFVNMVLYRLLFAQSMVEGLALGELGRFMGDPELPSVDVLVHLPDFYPRHYPLSPADVRHVLHQGHSLEEAATRCLDQVLIHPHLVRLYRKAAEWNGTPVLARWVLRGEPVYPSGTPRFAWLAALGDAMARRRGPAARGPSAA
jgi:hypothetical protein